MSRQMSLISFNIQRWVAVLVTFALAAVFVAVMIFQDHSQPTKKSEETKPTVSSATGPVAVVWSPSQLNVEIAPAKAQAAKLKEVASTKETK